MVNANNFNTSPKTTFNVKLIHKALIQLELKFNKLYTNVLLKSFNKLIENWTVLWDISPGRPYALHHKEYAYELCFVVVLSQSIYP